MVTFIFVKIYASQVIFPVLWLKENVIYQKLPNETLFKCYFTEGSDMWWIASITARTTEIFPGNWRLTDYTNLLNVTHIIPLQHVWSYV